MNLNNYWLDYIALGFFFLSWVGYSNYAKVKTKKSHSLLGALPVYRQMWMQNVPGRQNKIVDTTIIGNLMRMITFFASTTIFIIAAIFAGFGAVEDVGHLTADMPLISESPLVVQKAKFLLLLLIFIYAFFKFTWSLRQNNFVSILIGAVAEDGTDPNNLVEKTSKLESLAAKSFNNGLRAYYFALAVLAWFLHPFLFMFATIIVILVLNRREFHSETLSILKN